MAVVRSKTIHQIVQSSVPEAFVNLKIMPDDRIQTLLNIQEYLIKWARPIFGPNKKGNQVNFSIAIIKDPHFIMVSITLLVIDSHSHTQPR